VARQPCSHTHPESCHTQNRTLPVGGSAYQTPPPPAIFPFTRGRLASTGLQKKLQRAQVQGPGKTFWNVLTANTELALAA
jgi:hypothetical protein